MILESRCCTLNGSVRWALRSDKLCFRTRTGRPRRSRLSDSHVTVALPWRCHVFLGHRVQSARTCHAQQDLYPASLRRGPAIAVPTQARWPSFCWPCARGRSSLRRAYARERKRLGHAHALTARACHQNSLPCRIFVQPHGPDA
eukprot:6180079-Pleurochrysis_carterae.AAC.2